MFRESDYVAPKLHHTYNKTTPSFQRAAQSARFDEYLEDPSERDREKLQNVPAVPSTQSVFYDPSHIRADWTGLVSKEYTERKHVSNSSNTRTGIISVQSGLVSTEDGSRRISSRPHNEQANASDPYLISGVSDIADWKSNNQRLFEQEPTHRDQLSLHKRILPRKQYVDYNERRSSSIESSVERSNHKMRRGSNSLLANLGASLVDRVDG